MCFNPDLIKAAAERLRIDRALIEAVVTVESSGRPFLPHSAKTAKGVPVPDYPIMRYEGHVFYRLLRESKKPELQPEVLLTADPTRSSIIHPKLKPGLGGLQATIDKYDDLFRAAAINEELAYRSASYGAFQIMGFNYQVCGCTSASEFYKLCFSPEGQLNSFLNFLHSQPNILRALVSKDWKTFAKLYNGPGYAKQSYDTKLATAYLAASRRVSKADDSK
jgi:hypothetical protein